MSPDTKVVFPLEEVGPRAQWVRVKGEVSVGDLLKIHGTSETVLVEEVKVKLRRSMGARSRAAIRWKTPMTKIARADG